MSLFSIDIKNLQDLFVEQLCDLVTGSNKSQKHCQSW